MSDIFNRSDWLIRHLNLVPDLILHMRDQAMPSLQASSGPAVQSSGEKARPPMRLEPVDDADELWAVLCSLAGYFAERTGQAPPPELARQRSALDWWGIRTVQGVRSVEPHEVYGDALVLVRFLRDRAWSLAVSPEYSVPVDELVDAIVEARRKYPNAPAPMTAKHRCPVCGQHGVEPRYSEKGDLLGLLCWACGASKDLS